MKNKEHPNAEIIKLKIKELRREKISESVHLILDRIERLVDNNPTLPMVPGENSDNL